LTKIETTIADWKANVILFVQNVFDLGHEVTFKPITDALDHIALEFEGIQSDLSDVSVAA
jgi:hypothetical protein